MKCLIRNVEKMYKIKWIRSRVNTLKNRAKSWVIIAKSVTLSGIFEALRSEYRMKPKNIIPTELLNNRIQNKIGLEIGGPTFIFMKSHIFPIYRLANEMDNVNYSSNTIWSDSNVTKQRIFNRQIINEASNLTEIDNENYDFVVSSNVVEHLSNPLLAMLEMKRVTRPNGLIITIVPHRDVIFDHKRNITSLEFLVESFESTMVEGDISHLDVEKIFADYDLDLDPPAGNLDSFKERTFNNMSNRALHQTVFNTELLLKMFNWSGIRILNIRTSLNIGHILVIGEKSDCSLNEIQKFNSRFLASNADWRHNTIFRSEKIRKNVQVL